jgi:uncharacterized YccA/Bax inhibitor family protein
VKYLLLIGVTAIVARVARARFRRAIGRQAALKEPRPARSSVSLALLVTMGVVIWPLSEAVNLAAAEPARLRDALLWAIGGLVAPLAAAYAYRRAKAAGVPSFVVVQSTLTSYSFAGLALAAAAAAVWLSRVAF